MIPEDIRADFPLLSEVCYLDSAATSLSPEPVLAAMLEYEHIFRANAGRGVHRLAQVASQKYWDAHQKVGRFVGARRRGDRLHPEHHRGDQHGRTGASLEEG